MSEEMTKLLNELFFDKDALLTARRLKNGMKVLNSLEDELYVFHSSRFMPANEMNNLWADMDEDVELGMASPTEYTRTIDSSVAKIAAAWSCYDMLINDTRLTDELDVENLADYMFYAIKYNTPNPYHLEYVIDEDAKSTFVQTYLEYIDKVNDLFTEDNLV